MVARAAAKTGKMGNAFSRGEPMASPRVCSTGTIRRRVVMAMELIVAGVIYAGAATGLVYLVMR